MLYFCNAIPMHDVVPDTVDIHGYANDHALNQSFPGSLQDEENEIIHRLEHEITDINNQMDENGLKRNSDKTEFILMMSK